MVDACDLVDSAVVESLVGEVSGRTYTIERFSECRWAGASTEVILSIEEVADPELYLDHSIEGSDPEDVEELAMGQRTVLFRGEALVAKHDGYIVMVTSSTPDPESFNSVLSAALRSLSVN